MIVCFGDSLTAGFQSPTPQNPMGQATPYAAFLKESLGGLVDIRVSGICGELTGEMVSRFDRDALQWSPSYVIILGGTNDLGCNVPPTEIYKNLILMYEQAGLAKMGVIPVTVPSIRVDLDEAGPDGKIWLRQHVERRHELNSLIREYAVLKELPVVDLFTATADASTGQLAAQFSNDGLHLTTDGYRLLAQLLYQQVLAKIGTNRLV